jgi:hypothetical protein
MTKISLTVTDKQVKQSLKVLGRAAPNIINKHINETLVKAANRVKKYPRKLKNQQYVRTGRFGEKVKVVKAKRKGAAGSWKRQAFIEATARTKYGPYSVYVTGNAKGKGQAKIHQKRWKVMADEVTKASKPLIGKIERDIKSSLKKAGA